MDEQASPELQEACFGLTAMEVRAEIVRLSMGDSSTLFTREAPDMSNAYPRMLLRAESARSASDTLR